WERIGWPALLDQAATSGIEPGSVVSSSRTWPGSSSLMALPSLTIGIGQSSPLQSRVRSTVNASVIAVSPWPRHVALHVHRPGSWAVPGGSSSPARFLCTPSLVDVSIDGTDPQRPGRPRGPGGARHATSVTYP